MGLRAFGFQKQRLRRDFGRRLSAVGTGGFLWIADDRQPPAYARRRDADRSAAPAATYAVSLIWASDEAQRIALIGARPSDCQIIEEKTMSAEKRYCPSENDQRS